MSQESELGTLIVVVLKARNLIDKHSFYKQDVFAQVSFHDTVKKTPVDIKGGQHPVWDSELRFPVPKAISNKTRKIEVSCFAKEHRSDDLLGQSTVDITETLKTGEFDDWVSLDIAGVARGEVYLEMTYFSSAPAPDSLRSSTASRAVPHGHDLTRRPSKLSPSERLYRPPQLTTSHAVPQTGNHPSSSASQGRHSPHSLSKSRESTLPPLPEKDQLGQTPLPGVLKPGGASRPHQALGNTSSQVRPPSFLRPGNGKSPSPRPQSPDLTHIASVSPPSFSPRPYQLTPSCGYSSYNESSATNPYLSASPLVSSFTPVIPPGSNTMVPLEDYSTYNNTMVPPTPTWDQPGSTMSEPSFPMPMAPNVPQSDLRQTKSYQGFGYHQPAVPSSPPIDLYLSAHYQAPLTSPQDTNVYTRSSSLHSRRVEPKPDSDRQEVLRKAEEDATRRWEQEQRDLELALELDRQLNT